MCKGARYVRRQGSNIVGDSDKESHALGMSNLVIANTSHLSLLMLDEGFQGD
jgi:hypothetical protein